jgi:hypothetical protein
MARKKSKGQGKPQTWVLLADTHNGSTTGLTAAPQSRTQERLLERWRDAIAWFGPAPDVVVLNGDGIDGADRKSHDVVTPDMHKQAEDCAECLLMWGARREYIIVGGTGYHTEADGQELDRLVVGALVEKLRDAGNTETLVTYRRKLKTTINDWFRLEMRHKISRSGVPHGRSTSQMRAKYWQVIGAALKSSQGRHPAHWPHLTVYAHVHYYNWQEDAYGAVCSLPAWQALGGKYGEKEMDGHCDVGALRLTIGAKEEDGWERHYRLYLPALVERTEKR